MRNVTSPSSIAWCAVTLRGFILAGFSAALLSQGGGAPALVIALLLAALWNLALALPAFLGRTNARTNTMAVLLDLGLANLLVALGRPRPELAWLVGLLPLASAALFFEARGWLAIAFASAAALGAQQLLSASPAGAGLYALLAAGLYAPLGWLIGRLRLWPAAAERQAIPEASAPGRKEGAEPAQGWRWLLERLPALSAAQDDDGVLESALQLGAGALEAAGLPGASLVGAAFLCEEGEPGERSMKVRSTLRLSPNEATIALPGSRGLLGRVLREGQAQLAELPSEDPELGRLAGLGACRSACCLPLLRGSEVAGALLFAHAQADCFNAGRLELLEAIARQAGLALQNARRLRQLEAEKESLLDLQEKARRKLARDLHDGATQSVAALAMRVNFARRLMERDGEAAAEELQKAEELARQTTRELRHLLFTLSPQVLESQGLVAALETMAEKVRETFGQEVRVEADSGLLARLEMKVQAVLFSIAEEAVSNARTHAGAKTIWVRLSASQGDLAVLEIEDDGVGFDPNRPTGSLGRRDSRGIATMRAQAEMINGVLAIAPAKSRGTRVSLSFPLSAQAAEILRRRS